MVIMQYKIKQITQQTREEKDIRYFLLWYDSAVKKGFNLDDYTTVYEGETAYSDDVNETLENIFFVFNQSIPKDFYGHSLSVSDIIELDGVNSYVDSVGFVKLEIC